MIGQYLATIAWIVAAAFAVSDVLVFLAVIHSTGKKDWEMALFFTCVFLAFAAVCIIAVEFALWKGRSL